MTQPPVSFPYGTVKYCCAIQRLLCGLGYWVMRENINRIDSNCPFTVQWDQTHERLLEVYYDFFNRGGILYHPH